MKKVWWFAGIMLVLGFLAASWFRYAGNGESQATQAVSSERERIRAFWAAYHAATEARIQGRYLEAVQQYRRALEIDPEHEESLYYLGNSLFELGRLQEAKDTYLELTRLNPSSQRAFSRLGVTSALMLPGLDVDWDQARRAFKRMVEINQEESGPFLRLGLVSLQQGRLGEAEDYFETAAGFRSPEGLFLAGFVEYRHQRWNKAVDYFARVLELAAQEARISGRGVTSEGDVRIAQGGPLTPLQAAQLKARIFLLWTAARMGGYPPSIPEDFRVQAHHETPARRLDAVPAIPGGATWVDFDQDGDLDLSVAGGRSHRLALFQNQSGRFRPVQGLPGGATGSDLAWGDADGDGDLDLLLIGSDWGFSARPTLYLNEGSSKPVLKPEAGFAQIQELEHVVRARFVDLDADGRQDLALASAGTPCLIFLRNQGGGRFQRDSELKLPDVNGIATDLVVSDVNLDGRPDLLLVRWKQPLVLLLNRGEAGFVDATVEWGLGGLTAPGFRALLFDYNRDRRPDLLLAGYSPYGAVVRDLLNPSTTQAAQAPMLLANRKDRFEDVTAGAGLPGATSTTALAAADLNRDGWIDLVLAEGGPDPPRLSPSRILLNQQGRFQNAKWLPAFTHPADASGVAVAAGQAGNSLIYLSGIGLFRINLKSN